MHSIRQKCRPKHQVLVLKCYPRTTKGAVDVKPNSSELSYLLFYATTRRSKVHKVGSFLEKKTASDVWHARIGNVQITLQILTALIEKSPRDLPLYAPYVLKILSLIQQSHDITMVESSVPMFEAFCQNHDSAAFSAEQEFVTEYSEIIRTYATFASTSPPPSKTPISAPVAMRWRSVGLQAVKSVASSEALAPLVWRQLALLTPILLQNIWSDDANYIELLQQKANLFEKVDIENALRRRGSVTTVPKSDGAEPNPTMLLGSAADVDKLAEEDIGVLALHCLRQLFMGNNRQQIRGATTALVKFISDRVAQGETLTRINKITGDDKGWASSVFQMVCRWAPVQDRYVILVAAMEKLLNSPVSGTEAPPQIVLATMIDSLLKSDINLIGLSVMDIQLGLIRHMIRVLHPDAIPTPKEGKTLKWENDEDGSFAPPSVANMELLARLQQCLKDLATHIYYADQITDMVSAILTRLKPGTVDDKVDATVNSAPSLQSASEESADTFFAHPFAKLEALKAVKQILLVANHGSKLIGSKSARNNVDIRAWDGTQFLLRDADINVRKAYIDTVLTWLDLEIGKADLELYDDKPSGRRAKDGMSRRPVSNSSHPHRDKVSKQSKVRFLQRLHLAVYDNALQYIESEADLSILHLLLTLLNEKLGINAVRAGLPMVVRLQEDIQDVESPASKVRLGSLCHGYFWALTRMFKLGSSDVGLAITDEISRRQEKGLWVPSITLPPLPMDKISAVGDGREYHIPTSKAELESLKPFDGVPGLVIGIVAAYEASMISPPTSPLASPARNLSLPTSSLATEPPPKVPEKTKHEMLEEWDRDALLASMQESSKAASLNGSKTATTAQRTFLTVNGPSPPGGHNGTASPQIYSTSRPSSQVLGGGVGLQRFRLNGHDVSPGSESSRNSVTRVDQLRQILSGRPTTGLVLAHSDASSESLVSLDFTVSDISLANQPVDGSTGRASLDRGPLASHPPRASSEIPPVPRIPTALATTPFSEPKTAEMTQHGTVAQDHAAADVARRHNSVRRPKTARTLKESKPPAATPDLELLLKGIDISEEKGLGYLAQPPY